MWLKSFLRRGRGLWRSETIYQEITDELQFHIDMRVEENIRRGMSPDEARRDAERRFGNLTLVKEQGYDVRGGRDFTPQDTRQSQRVAIINESMARRLFGSENPLGRHFGDYRLDLEIVGVVKDTKYRGLREQAGPMFYAPFYQFGSQGRMTLVARTAADPTTVAAAVQREARAFDDAMPVYGVETIARQVEDSLSQERLVATLSSIFGLLALSLACIGLYGVMAYDVARRTHETGIRMALGASTRQIARLLLGETLWLVGIGVVIGLGAALAATRWVKSLLFGLPPHDPLAIAPAVLLLLAVAAVAGYLPARRASRIDPMVALRNG